MPAVLEGAVPPPHLHHLTVNKSWPSPFKYLNSPSPAHLPMSPESLHSYLPHLHDHAVPTQDLSNIPTSGWFGPSVPAPDQNEASYASYGYGHSYVTPHASAVAFSPAQFPNSAAASVSGAGESSTAAYSPASNNSRLKVSEAGQAQFSRPTTPYIDTPRTSAEPSVQFQTAHLEADTKPPNRPRSSPSTFTPNQSSTGPVEFNWTMDPLGIATPNMQEHYYSGSSYPSVRARSPRWSEPASDLHTDIAAPQPRRMYAPIAPHPMGLQGRTSVLKRNRDDDELSDQSKRRKRSDSNATNSVDLTDEDRLLIRLKDEESMPWKDIAARFQSDLGKAYQIPALQMRLKRLRERMRVWTETDVRALRMAHEYWAQNKFDIIAQKMLEFGAAEKWTSRQCARKWAEIDPGPTPYTTYEHPPAHSYAPYTMSPVESGFMPYLGIP